MSMKYLFIIFLSFCTSMVLNAQSFQPFENTVHPDFTTDFKELGNGNFIYVSTFIFPENLFNTFQDLDSIYTSVKLLNEDLNLLAELPIKSNSEYEYIDGTEYFYR